MPYVRTTRRINYRPRRTVRRVLRGKPKVSKNKSAIYTLSRKVNKIQRRVGARTHHMIFGKTHNVNVTTSYIKQQLILPQSQPGETAWTQIFNMDSSGFSNHELMIKSIHTEYKVDPADEESPIDITVTLIAPKSRKIYEDTYNATTGALSLVSGTDYYMEDGLCLVNKQRWKLYHYRRTTTVQQDGTQGLEFPVSSNNGRIKLTNLNWKIVNQNGNWNQVNPDDLPYYMRLFFVVFNNNNPLDFESPVFKQATVMKCVTHQ